MPIRASKTQGSILGHIESGLAGDSLRDLSPWPILYELDLYGNETFSKVVSGIKTWPQLNADLPAIASGVQVPRPIMYELDLYNLWPQLNADLSTIVSGVQAPGQLYMSWTCYKMTGTIPAAIERGLCLAWTARWMKKITASENSQLNVPAKGSCAVVG